MDMEKKVESLAYLLHESGREAVEQKKIYRNDLPVKPFCEWSELNENAKEGRRMMARFLLEHHDIVIVMVEDFEYERR